MSSSTPDAAPPTTPRGPAVAHALPLFGRAKGSVRIIGDVLAPLVVEWDAMAADDP